MMRRGGVSVRWYNWRRDLLEREGFSANEAAVIANCRPSMPGIRALRRERIAEIVQAQSRYGLNYDDAKRYVISRIESEGRDIITWSIFRRILYPDNKTF